VADAGPYAAALGREPALLTALMTLVGGFVAQAGPGHVASLKALGTSVTVSGLQGALTRQRVYSPCVMAVRWARRPFRERHPPPPNPSMRRFDPELRF
jgi:hypothetical protein